MLTTELRKRDLIAGTYTFDEFSESNSPDRLPSPFNNFLIEPRNLFHLDHISAISKGLKALDISHIVKQQKDGRGGLWDFTGTSLSPNLNVRIAVSDLDRFTDFQLKELRKYYTDLDTAGVKLLSPFGLAKDVSAEELIPLYYQVFDGINGKKLTFVVSENNENIVKIKLV
jgi:hypothetical protein